ncbi:hypothetical protein TRIUR3_21969 [Triticum urartu]|uniref:Uncharacterized protein n=1 Tax=Triticum urartu TaxID=4572 RepID=M7ZNZ1_TRIUA|nr:hypothetical protein TRIUR3_21969 [Triticum urartu]
MWEAHRADPPPRGRPPPLPRYPAYSTRPTPATSTTRLRMDDLHHRPTTPESTPPPPFGDFPYPSGVSNIRLVSAPLL